MPDNRMPNSGMTAPPRFDRWKPQRQRRWTRLNRQGQGQGPAPAPQQSPLPMNVPPPQQAPPSFLPMTPQFEAGRRGAEDQLSAQLAQIGIAREQIPYFLNFYGQRDVTDKGYANNALDENLAARGIFDSTVNPYLRTRDIDTPYGRRAQDRTLAAEQQYADLAGQEGGAQLSYNQSLMELLLGRAGQVAAEQPLELPRFSQRTGRRTPKKTKPKSRKPPRRRNR